MPRAHAVADVLQAKLGEIRATRDAADATGADETIQEDIGKVEAALKLGLAELDAAELAAVGHPQCSCHERCITAHPFSYHNAQAKESIAMSCWGPDGGAGGGIKTAWARQQDPPPPLFFVPPPPRRDTPPLLHEGEMTFCSNKVSLIISMLCLVNKER